MTPAVFALIALELLAGCVIAWQSICHVNRMTRDTSLCIVAAWAALGGAGAAHVAGILVGHAAPDLYTAALLAGLALLLTADRRRL